MPRVSEAHLAARRQQILDAALTCFRRNGFHTTSMQDVIAEAGLSVGAVYRYFRGKSEIIAAIVEGYAREVGETLTVSAGRDRHLADAMRDAIDLIESSTGPDGIMRLAVQVWAEAIRDETTGALVKRVYQTMRANFVRLARHAVDTGDLPEDADADAAGAALLSLVLGYGLQRMLTGRPDPDTYERGLRAIFGTRASRSTSAATVP